VPRELQIERELSRAGAAGSERAERLASLLTLSYEPMLVWQLNGPIEFWNTGAERLYGFAPEEAIGHSSHALLQTKFPIEFTEWITQLQNERYWSGELRHICKDGRKVIVESRQQLLSNDTVIEVNRDVTERMQIEADLRESEQQLRWSGFGGRIIEQVIAQLKGESRFDWRAEGLVCEITLRV
jgi:PAS domain S-box-containing protein